MDRLNVRNILRRKKYKLEGNNYNRALCTQNREETTFHLFVSCNFSRAYWGHHSITWDFGLSFFKMMGKARQQHPTSFFMEIIMLGAWLIWKQRNDYIFN
jgi:hypothetical protein